MWEWRTIARSPAVRSGITDRDEVQRPIQVAGPQTEVPGADRGDEAVVERLGQVERRVDAVPAYADGELVGAQLAGVEDPEELDLLEVRLEQLAVLMLVVLAQVPGVVRLLGARGGEREAVGGRDVGDPRAAGDPLQEPNGVVNVLDRLQEHRRVD